MFDLDLLSERARVTPDKRRPGLRRDRRAPDLRRAECSAPMRAAATLQSLGIEPGDRFGLLAYNCLEFLEFFFAAGKSGAIVVPLSTRATAHELGAHRRATAG